MCGIAGIISTDQSLITKDRLLQMTDALKHRGPDGEKTWISPSGNCGFGHRRLAIIDLSESGAQPMHYLNRYTIVHNGELFNYTEIRESLRNKGYTFSTNSDTEVILASYDCYGERCLDHFDGMFAFAIWDEQENQLFCARDRFGEKPFFFTHDEQTNIMVFASEMKAINNRKGSGSINERMLLRFLAIGHTDMVTEPFATFYENISQLPAAHYLYFSPGKNGIETRCYWICDKGSNRDISDEEAENTLNELLTVSVTRRLRSDVPIGSSLSGGLDSSAIVAKICQLQPAAHHTGFSAVFPGFVKDESPYISQVSEKFRVESFRITPTAKDLLNDLDRFLYIHEAPVASSSVYAQYKIFELAGNKGVKVLLDGQGADEIFAGYGKYIHWYLQELLGRGRFGIMRKEKKLLQVNHIPFEWNTLNYVATLLPGLTAKRLEAREISRIHNDDLDEGFVSENFLKTDFYKPVVTKLNDILFFNTFQSGLNELVTYADRNSMAHGREVRLPFLFHDLVSFMFSLPSRFKIRNGFTKWLLRNTMKEVLPPGITWRRDKVGFETPQSEWMKDAAIKNAIAESKDLLVSRKILRSPTAGKKNQPAEDPSAEWRYLIAGRLIQ